MAALLHQCLQHCQQFYQERCYWSNPEIQILYVPVVAYWMLGGIYDFLGYVKIPFVEKHRIHTQQEDKRNRMTKAHVIKRVLFSHFLQAVLALSMLLIDPPSVVPTGGALKVFSTVIVAAFVMDAWQYFVHRCVGSCLHVFAGMM